MKKFIFPLFIALLFMACNQPKELTKIEQWEVFEIELSGPTEGTPFIDVELNATFKLNEKSVKVPGFYDGNGIFRIRFSPDEVGDWTYQTSSNIEALSGKKGSFECVTATGKNHGPLQIVNSFYLEYADKTPFYSIGTTAYQWTSVKQSIQEKTLETLVSAFFNKIRMCVFPKWYKYGNDTEPWLYPFKRNGDQNDFTQPNYEFFQNFDLRVKQLRDMGIQADVILFHPYDKNWGYYLMGDEMNEKYVQYMIARISAYRNVWWSLANEWDIPEIKDTVKWESIGTLLQKEDAYNHLRGIHNWYGSEDHFYDHTEPWVTHVSTQTHQFFNAIKWRNQYQKPLLFDEMRYEGDVASSWGSLTAQQMASYFWMAGLSGGYPTHGDTFNNDSDTTEVRWWAKGGTLMGESPERIAFFKSIMEQAPVTEMTPKLIDNGDPENLDNNIYLFSKPGEFYLAYVANPRETIQIELPGNQEYKLEIIDTWNKKITEQTIAKPGKFEFKTTFPFCALRITKKQ